MVDISKKEFSFQKQMRSGGNIRLRLMWRILSCDCCEGEYVQPEWHGSNVPCSDAPIHLLFRYPYSDVRRNPVVVLYPAISVYGVSKVRPTTRFR